MTAEPSGPGISQIRAADIEELRALASAIWRRHYADIISAAQIEYMLAQRYAPEVLNSELQRGDVWWDQLRIDGRMAGFCSYLPGGSAEEMKVDKLYVHHEYQRRGYGGLLLERTAAVARSRGLRILTLTVNKHNRAAIAAYIKHGFSITDAVIKDIGGGFVMDDYVMSRSV